MADFLDIEAGRNPSYANSVYLAFERGIFRAPGSLLNMTGWPILTIVAAVFFLFVGIALWLLVRLHFLVFGLLGLIRPRTVRGDKSVLSVPR
jgi:hypothetical protein